MSVLDHESHNILQSVREQEVQFERLTQELQAEQQSVATQLHKCRYGSETGSLSSITRGTEQTFQWQPAEPLLVDSCLKVLQDRGLMNIQTSFTYADQSSPNGYPDSVPAAHNVRVLELDKRMNELGDRMQNLDVHDPYDHYNQYSDPYWNSHHGQSQYEQQTVESSQAFDNHPPSLHTIQYTEHPESSLHHSNQQLQYNNAYSLQPAMFEGHLYEDQQASFMDSALQQPSFDQQPQFDDRRSSYQQFDSSFSQHAGDDVILSQHKLYSSQTQYKTVNPQANDSQLYGGPNPYADIGGPFADKKGSLSQLPYNKQPNSFQPQRGSYSDRESSLLHEPFNDRQGSFQQPPNDRQASFQQGPIEAHQGTFPQERQGSFQEARFDERQGSFQQRPFDDRQGSFRPGPYEDEQSPRYEDRQGSFQQGSFRQKPAGQYSDDGGSFQHLAPQQEHLSGTGAPNGEQRWRDPELPEVIAFLSHPSDVIKANSAAYLQHLCYKNDDIKNEARELGGIPALVQLLANDVPEVHKSACGALRNLSFGPQQLDNKLAIKDCGGIPELKRLLERSRDEEVEELVTGILWNLSSVQELKKPVIDNCLVVLVDKVMIPASEMDSSGTTVFRNASGVLRNVSSEGEYARRQLRECGGLLDAILKILEAAIGKNNIDNKAIENCVCILRNLSYACQEVQDPYYLKKKAEKAKEEEATDGTAGCFGKKSAKRAGMDMTNAPTQAYKNCRLWQPEILDVYLALLKDCTNPETLEAAAGAIQNLTACDWQPASVIRASVRQRRQLPIFVELINLEADRVVCASATALRNLAIDHENKILIGKYAIKALVDKLPQAHTQSAQAYQPQPFQLSDDTIAQIEAAIYEVIKDHSNISFARKFVEEGGCERVMYICRNGDKYKSNVVRYAAKLLHCLYGMKELHEEFKKRKFTAKDFNPILKPSQQCNTTLERSTGQSEPVVTGYNDQTTRLVQRQRMALPANFMQPTPQMSRAAYPSEHVPISNQDHLGTPQLGRTYSHDVPCTPQMGRGYPQDVPGTPQMGRDYPQDMPGTPQMGRGYPQDMLGTPQIGQAYPQDMPGTPQMGRTYSQDMPGTPQMGRAYPQDMPSTPQMARVYTQDMMGTPQMARAYQSDNGRSTPQYGNRGYPMDGGRYETVDNTKMTPVYRQGDIGAAPGIDLSGRQHDTSFTLQPLDTYDSLFQHNSSRNGSQTLQTHHVGGEPVYATVKKDGRKAAADNSWV